MEKRGVDTNGNLIHRLKKLSVEDHNHLYEAELDDEVDADGLNDESLPIPKVPKPYVRWNWSFITHILSRLKKSFP